MIPAKLSEIQKQMDTLLYQVEYSKKLFQPSIAYTYSRTASLYGAIYKIFVNNADEELAKFLYVHECGHIVLSHAKNLQLRSDLFLDAKLNAAYTKISHYFPDFNEYKKVFKNLVYNIVMDFEVNSTYFTEEEQKFMNERTSALLGIPSRGLWPADYDYPLGLSWNGYLNLILLDPEKFLVKILSTINQHLKENKNGNFNGVLSEEEFEELKEKLSKNELNELKKMSEVHNGATFDIPNGLMSGKSDTSNKTVRIDFLKFSSMEELLKKITNTLHLKKNRQIKRDLLYNSNRRKFGTSVIIPKEVKEIVIEEKKLYLLIDVSGSVNPIQVHDFISTFKEVQSNFKSTRIITWTTELVNEWNINEPIPNNYGGGTNIAAGISYLNKKYKIKKNDVLFVISDFCDQLFHWQIELSKLNCEKYAINWALRIPNMNPGFKKIFQA